MLECKENRPVSLSLQYQSRLLCTFIKSLTWKVEPVRSYLLQRDFKANPLLLMNSGTGVTALEPRRTLSGLQIPACPLAGHVLAQMWEACAQCLWLSQDGSWSSSPGHFLPFYYFLRFLTFVPEFSPL